MENDTVDGFHQQALQQANTRLKAQRDKLLEALEELLAHHARICDASITKHGCVYAAEARAAIWEIVEDESHD